MLLEIIGIIPLSFLIVDDVLPLISFGVNYDETFRNSFNMAALGSLHSGSLLSNKLRTLKFSDFGKCFWTQMQETDIVSSNSSYHVPIFCKTDRTCQIKHSYFQVEILSSQYVYPFSIGASLSSYVDVHLLMVSNSSVKLLEN